MPAMVSLAERLGGGSLGSSSSSPSYDSDEDAPEIDRSCNYRYFYLIYLKNTNFLKNSENTTDQRVHIDISREGGGEGFTQIRWASGSWRIQICLHLKGILFQALVTVYFIIGILYVSTGIPSGNRLKWIGQAAVHFHIQFWLPLYQCDPAQRFANVIQ